MVNYFEHEMGNIEPVHTVAKLQKHLAGAYDQLEAVWQYHVFVVLSLSV
jgi:hypothetical protein